MDQNQTQSPQETLYDSFDQNLYKIEVDDGSVLQQLLSGDSQSQVGSAVSVPAEQLGSGIDTSINVNPTGSVQSGKKLFDNTVTGYILGFDPKDGMAKFYIGNTTSYLNWDGTTMTLAGSLTVSQSYISGSSIQVNSLGMTFSYNNTLNGLIYMASMSSPFSTGAITMQVGPITGGVAIQLNCTGSNVGDFSPGNGDTLDLGTSSNYWNEINYKTLTDRGCLGWFDVGVELQDGRIVSDIEAIKGIQKHPTKLTIYGVPMLDYSTMPKSVYRPAKIADKDIKDDRGNVRFKQGDKIGQDGAETTALISIMIGSLKELAGRIEILEAKVEKYEAKAK